MPPCSRMRRGSDPASGIGALAKAGKRSATAAGGGQAPALAVAPEHIHVAQGGGRRRLDHTTAAVAPCIAVTQPSLYSQAAIAALDDADILDADVDRLTLTDGGIIAALFLEPFDRTVAGDLVQSGRQLATGQHGGLGAQPALQQALELSVAGIGAGERCQRRSDGKGRASGRRGRRAARRRGGLGTRRAGGWGRGLHRQTTTRGDGG